METGLLARWPEDSPPLVWTARGIGHGFSSVAIADGMIYTAGNIDDKTVISALDMEGRMLWQAENGKAWTGSFPGRFASPWRRSQ